jgi:transcriptional regulator with XRE-family HTH domain
MNDPQVPTSHQILDALREKGLSIRKLADHLNVNRAHLQRVLSRERPGSRAFRRAAADFLAATPATRRNDEINGPLLDAAVHVFFLKRGHFQSPICWNLNRRKAKHSAYSLA